MTDSDGSPKYRLEPSTRSVLSKEHAVQLSIAISMKRIADSLGVLESRLVPTVVPMTAPEILQMMGRVGQEPRNLDGTDLDPTT